MRLEFKPTAGLDLIAVVAMAAAILAIIWARVEIIGTHDIEDALSGRMSQATVACVLHSEALLQNRSLAGFTQ